MRREALDDASAQQRLRLGVGERDEAAIGLPPRLRVGAVVAHRHGVGRIRQREREREQFGGVRLEAFGGHERGAITRSGSRTISSSPTVMCTA